MKFKIFTLLLFTFSCAPHLETLNLKNPYDVDKIITNIDYLIKRLVVF